MLYIFLPFGSGRVRIQFSRKAFWDCMGFMTIGTPTREIKVQFFDKEVKLSLLEESISKVFFFYADVSLPRLSCLQMRASYSVLFILFSFFINYYLICIPFYILIYLKIFKLSYQYDGARDH